MKEEPKSWSDVWFHHVKMGRPYEEAAFRADKWETYRNNERKIGKSENKTST